MKIYSGGQLIAMFSSNFSAQSLQLFGWCWNRLFITFLYRDFFIKLFSMNHVCLFRKTVNRKLNTEATFTKTYTSHKTLITPKINQQFHQRRAKTYVRWILIFWSNRRLHVSSSKLRNTHAYFFSDKNKFCLTEFVNDISLARMPRNPTHCRRARRVTGRLGFVQEENFET